MRLIEMTTFSPTFVVMAGAVLAVGLIYVVNRRLARKCRVLDIALESGFEYEQSYIRAFRACWGISPGQCRKERALVPIIRATRAVAAESAQPGQPICSQVDRPLAKYGIPDDDR